MSYNSYKRSVTPESIMFYVMNNTNKNVVDSFDDEDTAKQCAARWADKMPGHVFSVMRAVYNSYTEPKQTIPGGDSYGYQTDTSIVGTIVSEPVLVWEEK